MRREWSSGMTLLVVEDDECLRRGVAREMRSHFKEVETAASVAGALARLLQPGIDLVLTDWNLGDGIGEQVMEAAHAKLIPVVIYSANVGFHNPRHQAIFEKWPMVEKPARPEEILQMLAKAKALGVLAAG